MKGLSDMRLFCSDWSVPQSRRKYDLQQFRKTLTFCSLMIMSPAMVVAEDLVLGFQLGGTLSQAHDHATSNGWVLHPLSKYLPKEWVVDGGGAGLFVCEDRVLAIRRTFEGSVDQFAIMVQDVTLKRGLPKTSIVTFMAGNVRMSNIDARFEADDGSGVLVQLSSTSGKAKISTNVWSGIDCHDQQD